MISNPRTLKYILTIVQEGGFSKAAEKLFISQPSLSHHIIHFEKELGVQIFDRSVNPPKLTYAGERVVLAAREIQVIEERLDRELADIENDVSGRIRIGATLFRASSFIPTLFSEFSRRHPFVKLELMDDKNKKLIEMVRNRQLDFAFVSYGAEELNQIIISNNQVMLLAPADHPKVAAFSGPLGAAELTALAEEPFILLHAGHGMRKICDRIFRDAGISPNIRYEVHSIDTARQMVDKGLGFSFSISSPSHASLKNTRELELSSNAYSYPLYLCYKESAYFSRAMTAFVEMAKELLS